METYIFIIIHLSYIIFLMILVTSLSKKGTDDQMKQLLLLNSDGIFIPDNPTYNELYIQELNQDKEFIKYINILPYADKLVSKNGLYDLLSTYYKDNFDILNKIVPKSYILQNDIHKKTWIKIFTKTFLTKFIY